MGRIYSKGASDFAQCAHRIYDYVCASTEGWAETEERCRRCGAKLRVHCCGESLFLVKCPLCGIKTKTAYTKPFMLVKASGADEAAAEYREFQCGTVISMTQNGDNNLTIGHVGALKL